MPSLNLASPADIIVCSPSLTQQLSTEDEQHAPGSVMCSQVFKCISAGLSGQMPSEYMAVPEGSTELSTAPSCVNSTDKITSHPIEASTSNEVSADVLEVCPRRQTAKAMVLCESHCSRHEICTEIHSTHSTRHDENKAQRNLSENMCSQPEATVCGGSGLSAFVCLLCFGSYQCCVYAWIVETNSIAATSCRQVAMVETHLHVIGIGLRHGAKSRVRLCIPKDAVGDVILNTRVTSCCKYAELRQDASPDADQPSNGIQSSALLPRASLERQVSSVSLAESDAYPSTVAIVKCTTTPDTLPGELSTSISCASSCSHDENLHQSTVRVATDIIPPLSHRCENKTLNKDKLGESGKAVAKSPYASGLERSKGRNSQVRLAETHSKGLQVHHSVAANQVWRLGGSSIRVRLESARSRSALMTPSGLGLPVTPRRTKVISPHKSRTPDMSRLLGTPQRTRPGTPQRSRRSSRGPCKLVLRSSLEEFPSSRPCSPGGSYRRATIAPGTVLPSFKSDTKLGAYSTYSHLSFVTASCLALH